MHIHIHITHATAAPFPLHHPALTSTIIRLSINDAAAAPLPTGGGPDEGAHHTQDMGPLCDHQGQGPHQAAGQVSASASGPEDSGG
jgi:hypothetical protein